MLYVLMDDARKQSLAWARFEALQSHPPRLWDETAVAQFHEIVTALKEAFAVDLTFFRAPDSHLKQRIVGVSRIGTLAVVAPRKCRTASIAISSLSTDNLRASCSIFKTSNRRPIARSLDFKRMTVHQLRLMAALALTLASTLIVKRERAP